MPLLAPTTAGTVRSRCLLDTTAARSGLSYRYGWSAARPFEGSIISFFIPFTASSRQFGNVYFGKTLGSVLGTLNVVLPLWPSQPAVALQQIPIATDVVHVGATDIEYRLRMPSVLVHPVWKEGRGVAVVTISNSLRTITIGRTWGSIPTREYT